VSRSCLVLTPRVEVRVRVPPSLSCFGRQFNVERLTPIASYDYLRFEIGVLHSESDGSLQPASASASGLQLIVWFWSIVSLES
jgi:hypothetical protein